MEGQELGAVKAAGEHSLQAAEGVLPVLFGPSICQGVTSCLFLVRSPRAAPRGREISGKSWTQPIRAWDCPFVFFEGGSANSLSHVAICCNRDFLFC